MFSDLKSFSNSKVLLFNFKLVYCSIVCFYIFQVSNDSSLYILKKKSKSLKKVVISPEKISKILSLK